MMLWIEKFRPVSFDEIRGQAGPVATLTNFSENKSLPHLLIVGSPGTGKSCAVECLGRRLYGEYWRENTTFLSSGALFTQGRGYLEAEGRFSHLYRKEESVISNIKHIIRWYASMQPLNAPFKLLVFDEAETLSRDAQQALRRIMEKYSPTCRFVFIARTQSAIIPAISSRCLPLFFQPLPDPLIHTQLEYVLKEIFGINPGIGEEEMDLVVSAARGDMRRALTLLQIMTGGGGQKTDIGIAAMTETSVIAGTLFDSLRDQRSDLHAAIRIAETLMIDYGLSGREVLSEIRGVARREYNDPRVALALADADFALTSADSEFLQVNAALARIRTEVFDG